MTIHTMAQRSDEWFAIRRGKFTASDFDALMPAKSKPLDSWTDAQMKIVYRVAAERMTEPMQDASRVSASMQWGIETEDEARAAYEMETGQEVKQVGFFELDEWVGCSPDGLIGKKEGLEIKCPNSETHMRYMTEGNISEDYWFQIQGSLWITGREIWRCVSFDPRFKEEYQLHICNCFRYEQDIDRLKTRLEDAIAKAQHILGER
jgi:putative phage-type endonuclease